MKDHTSAHILIIEDTKSYSLLLSSLLTSNNRQPFETTILTSLKDAKLFLEKNTPDAILLDLNLPDSKDIDTINAMSHYGKDVPIIILTGNTNKELAYISLKKGMQDYIEKSEVKDGNLLVKTVEHAIDKFTWTKQIRENEKIFNDITENIRDVFWILNSGTLEPIYVSPAFELIWGYSIEWLNNHDGHWFSTIHEEDKERIINAYKTKLGNGDYHEEYRIIHKNGSIKWVLERAFPVYNDKGDIYRISGVTEEITYHKNLELQLRQAQKMEAIGQLAGGIAHDYSNMLLVIKGYIQMLLKEVPKNCSYYNKIRQVQKAAERSSQITQQLLAFSKKQVLEVQNYDLPEIVIDLKEMMTRLITDHIELSFEFDKSEKYPITVDRCQIEQVLINLVINARDAMPNGDGKISIKIKNTEVINSTKIPLGEYVILSVEDNGSGMSEETISHIFEPFFTTKSHDCGTGLGLATVYGVVEQLKGNIEVESKLNQGTRFDIYLPKNNEVPEDTPITQVKKTNTKTEKYNILLVEDESMIRELIKDALSNEGHTMYTATNGLEGIDTFNDNKEKIDLLITDDIMPKLTGHEMIKKILENNKNLPVIIMSGYMSNYKKEYDMLDANLKFIQKPFNTDQLIEIIIDIMDNANNINLNQRHDRTA